MQGLLLFMCPGEALVFTVELSQFSQAAVTLGGPLFAQGYGLAQLVAGRQPVAKISQQGEGL